MKVHPSKVTNMTEGSPVGLILSSLLNIALDVLFIVALHSGVGGAALATVIAQGVSAALVPALGYLGVAVTEPVIWCLCAAFLAVCYGTIGRRKRCKTSLTGTCHCTAVQ